MGSRLTHQVKDVHFNESVDVVVFNRTLGGNGVPHDGNITMCINQEIDQIVEPLGEEPDTKTVAENDGYKTPQARAVLLKKDMGEAKYEKNLEKHTKAMAALKKELAESKSSRGDYRSLPTTPEKAISRAKKDAKEVRKMWGYLSTKVKSAITPVEEASKKIVKKSFSKGKKSVMKSASKKKTSSGELHHDEAISDETIAATRDQIENVLKKQFSAQKRKLAEELSSDDEDEWGDVEGYEMDEDGNMPKDSFAKKRKK